MTVTSPEEQLNGFIDKFTPEVAELARACLTNVRARMPGAIQMVYDNYNALAIGFSPNDRSSDAILSIVLYPRWVNICFLQGAAMPDPNGLLQGSGNVVRNIRVNHASDLDDPAVGALISTAIEYSRVPMEGVGPGRLVIKLLLAKQRPRRPGK